MEITQRIQRAPGVQATLRSGLLRILFRKPKMATAALVVLVLLVFSALPSESPEEKAKKELATAIAAVGQLMILPEGDEPVLATVTDANALTAQQAFFTGSIDGDQLLLFPKSLKAVIYSPSRDKIINAGPIEQTAAPAEVSAKNQSSTNILDAETQKALTVEVRNGTSTAGLAARIAEKVRATSGFAVVSITDAAKKGFMNTVMVSRVSDARVAELAETLGADVVETVEGDKSSADVLIVVGADSGPY